ncbi:helix-turn-helix transcriptional regulator [Rhizorhabdus dicambivorans]|uniref:WYL domain-containing transcriptional regulator n=1 Tax=Rhizorhabdus dicambivorans TaxID=1850238 RepID=A0A2A4FTG6_9SPHN|nr:WYL domain-containing protein [Rhizorhabdus dicambivorans]ATE64596.1 WYL domain-containing transcriptional regulator [Rhizorhabdus dicambivorans]PCE41693.1 WYL domain-containing transcriptional regulator [Rhizorhabdus dicambivorans]
MSFGKAVDLLRLAMMSTGRRGVCLADVEAEFGGVRRTAQRMIAALQEAFPATEHHVADDGRHYWTLPARAIAPLLSPSADELVAMAAAITELERAGMGSEAGQLRTLSRKVRALVPPEKGTRLAVDEEALLEAMGYAARPGPRPSANSQIDEAISHALKGPFHLAVDYRARTEAAPSTRTIAPYGLLLGARRYLVGIDLARTDGRLRHYRVEDISRAEPLESSFDYPEDFNLADYAQRAFGSFHDDREYGEVIWKFAPAAADRAQRFLFHPSQRSEILDDGSLVVRFEASGHLEMAWHLYSWGSSVEVLAPSALAAMVHPYRRGDFPALP